MRDTMKPISAFMVRVETNFSIYGTVWKEIQHKWKMPKSRPTPEITKKVMQSPFFMKKHLFTALPGKITNHGFFYKISLGKNGFWTKINVHFRSANHFLCFDILSRSENPYQKTSKNNHFIKTYEKGPTIHSRVVS